MTRSRVLTVAVALSLLWAGAAMPFHHNDVTAAASIGELEFVGFPSQIGITGEEVQLEGWLKFNQKENEYATSIRLWVTGHDGRIEPAFIAGPLYDGDTASITVYLEGVPGEAVLHADDIRCPRGSWTIELTQATPTSTPTVTDTPTPTSTSTPTPTPTHTPTPTNTPTPTPCLDAYEPDNTWQQARLIEVNGTPQSHNFHTTDDVDYVKFAAQPDNIYTIRTLNLSASNDTTLTLYDTDGTTQLDYSDDDPENLPASKIIWLCTTAGTYFVKAAPFGSQIGGCDVTYDLEISAAPVPTPTPTVTNTPTPTSTPTPTNTPTPTATNTPTPEVTPASVEKCYCCSAGDKIYRIDASLFSGYLTDSATDSPLIHVTSPPAPWGWNQPYFEPDNSWKTGTEVWWDFWTTDYWVPLPSGCRPIGLRDDSGNQESINGTTHLYRHVFTLFAPYSGMQVEDAVLEMWSDNKTEWWWQGTSVSYDRQGYIGQVDLFPGHIAPYGGTYVLGIQNSNDYVSLEYNPQGTACRLCVTWAIPSGPTQIYLPLIFKTRP